MKLIKVFSFTIIYWMNIINGQHNPHHWSNRTGIVHLFEWKFTDIATECETFLAPKGYAGVQVSPVNENVIVPDRPWWERYQPMSYIIATRSGNEVEFSDMVKRCNDVGVRIYVDVLPNHMAAEHDQMIGTAGSTADVEKRNYPSVPYSVWDFHPPCVIDDYNNAWNVRNCELVGLPDLNQTVPWVRQRILEYLNRLIDFGVAGFRVDASKHMWPSDLQVIYNNLKNLSAIYPDGSRPFIYQEVIDLGGQEAVKKTEYNSLGVVTEFKFSTEISRAFNGGNKLEWFRTWGDQWGLLPTTDALVFIDNHDNQRGTDILSYKQPREYKMAVAFMLAHPYGFPRIMSSFKFENSDHGPPMDQNETIKSPIFDSITDQCIQIGWVCEHRWPEIYRMIRFRNAVGNTIVSNWWDNGNNQISFCRGNKGFLAINNDAENINRRLNTCLPAGLYCDVFTGEVLNGKCTGKIIYVGNDSYAQISLNRQIGVLALHTLEKL